MITWSHFRFGTCTELKVQRRFSGYMLMKYRKKLKKDYILTFKISLHYIELDEQRIIVKTLNWLNWFFSVFLIMPFFYTDISYLKKIKQFLWAAQTRGYQRKKDSCLCMFYPVAIMYFSHKKMFNVIDYGSNSLSVKLG